MHQQDKKNIITLSEHPAFEKHEIAAINARAKLCRDKHMDFLEALFRFLGKKRSTVNTFVRLKLDYRKRLLFERELSARENVRDEIRCVRKYFGHLKTNDAMALMMSLPDMLEDNIEALTFHGEASPADRMQKFARTFGLTHEDAAYCMFFFLMTREDENAADCFSMAGG